MSEPNYYNEFDLYAAQYLRNLIDAGLIAPGVVDTRSIEDVRPSDLAGFKQCHFFAGIGIWSLALRRAGWPDDRPIWTGSCPCQPFSAAGKGAGFADERHLWPAFHHLAKECKPECILGEQVANKDADDWIDLVQTDLEAMGYAVGAVPFPSASVGAPHLRDRLYWCAVGLADSDNKRLERRRGMRERAVELPAWPSGLAGGLGDTESERRGEARPVGAGHTQRLADASATGVPGPVNGFWRNSDWIMCRDPDGPKWRPVEAGTFPLDHGNPDRVGSLRAFGNAINAEQARVFVECVMEAM